jgi:putative acyl-CoA dehydrogenase
MRRYAPRVQLATHEVTNQPPEFVGENLYTTDRVLREAVQREGAGWADGTLVGLGEIVGSEQVLEWGEQANRYPPELTTFDRYGRRIDEVRFHPAYHALMDLAMRSRIHSIAWTGRRPGGHVAHAAMMALFSEAEAGTMCPVSMTYAAVPLLRREPDVGSVWTPKILEGVYDAPLRPIAEKAGVTVGMALTEKQGGSDVRANTTRAEKLGHGVWRLTGHKWFCSAPMSDGFVTLAQTGRGLTCFLVPRVAPDGSRNTIHLMRLKDKLGNRSNASSEIEYHGAQALLVGEEGRGVRTIIDMVHHTRLDTMASTLGIMRMALAQAVHHTRHRRAFQRVLIDQPLMRAVLADLVLEYEAAVLLTLRVARAFDASSSDEAAFSRLAVAVGKYWLTKRTANFVYECLECLGGAGYVEESPLPRLYREAPLNSIWEGSGNVIALDVLRSLQKQPAGLEIWRSEVAGARGGNATLDAAADTLFAELAGSDVAEARARWVAERLALVLQGALLVRHAPQIVADAFCGSRLGGDGGRTFGTLSPEVGVDEVLARGS